MFARRASVDDLQKFCIAAQVHKVFLDASVVEEIATAAGTVTSEKSKAASKTALILQTLHRLDSQYDPCAAPEPCHEPFHDPTLMPCLHCRYT